MKNKFPSARRLAAVMMIALFSAWLYPQAIPPDNDRQCADNLKALAFALLRYMGEHEGQLPAKISALYTEGFVVELSVFSCPASDRHVDDPAEIEALTDYQLVTVLTDKRPHLLVQDRFGSHNGSGQAYYSDQKIRLLPLPPPPRPGVAEPTAQGKTPRALFLVLLIPVVLALLVLVLRQLARNRRRRPSPRRMPTSIEVHYASGGHKTFTVQAGTTTIGRDEDNLLVIHDPEVSTHHATVTVTADGFRLKDLGSKNGTYVNGRRVNEQNIGVGDEILIGTTRLKLG